MKIRNKKQSLNHLIVCDSSVIILSFLLMIPTALLSFPAGQRENSERWLTLERIFASQEF